MEKWNKPCLPAGKAGVWIIGIIIILVLLVGGMYNRLVGLDQEVIQSWAQVENQLQRRNDLIPNLVNVVKGYAAHEKSIFIQVSEARAKLAGTIKIGSQADKIVAARELDGALSRLLAIAENYPDLKASENFIRLQDELAGTENRISVERMRYNDAVGEYNKMTRFFPKNIIASMFGFKAREMFEAAEGAEKAPAVSFD